MNLYNSALILIILFGHYILTAQPDTIFICNPGDPVQLYAPPGMFAYQWQGDANFENPTIANPIVFH